MAAWRALCATCSDNVVGFPFDILLSVVGHIYFVEQVVEIASAFGWASHRVRKWCVLRHKAETLSAMPVSVFAKLFYRERATICKAYLISGSDEQSSELRWTVRRRESKAHGKRLSIDDPMASQQSLTRAEQAHKAAYKENSPEGVVSLGQYPLAVAELDLPVESRTQQSEMPTCCEHSADRAGSPHARCCSP